MKERLIFHVDVNSAYLSWEAVHQLKNGAPTDIRTIPSIIGGDTSLRKGVVLAKSLPAKRFGIHTGEPVTDALTKCPTLQSFQPNFPLYHKYSKAFITVAFVGSVKFPSASGGHAIFSAHSLQIRVIPDLHIGSPEE